MQKISTLLISTKGIRKKVIFLVPNLEQNIFHFKVFWGGGDIFGYRHTKWRLLGSFSPKIVGISFWSNFVFNYFRTKKKEKKLRLPLSSRGNLSGRVTKKGTFLAASLSNHLDVTCRVVDPYLGWTTKFPIPNCFCSIELSKKIKGEFYQFKLVRAGSGIFWESLISIQVFFSKVGSGSGFSRRSYLYPDPDQIQPDPKHRSIGMPLESIMALMLDGNS